MRGDSRLQDPWVPQIVPVPRLSTQHLGCCLWQGREKNQSSEQRRSFSSCFNPIFWPQLPKTKSWKDWIGHPSRHSEVFSGGLLSSLYLNDSSNGDSTIDQTLLFGKKHTASQLPFPCARFSCHSHCCASFYQSAQLFLCLLSAMLGSGWDEAKGKVESCEMQLEAQIFPQDLGNICSLAADSDHSSSGNILRDLRHKLVISTNQIPCPAGWLQCHHWYLNYSPPLSFDLRFRVLLSIPLCKALPHHWHPSNLSKGPFVLPAHSRETRPSANCRPSLQLYFYSDAGTLVPLILG